MKAQQHGSFARGFAALVFAGACGLLSLTVATAVSAQNDQDSEKPYKIENGKVDKQTYNGWRRYTESCMRCHGPDGAGSSYAPSLVDSLKST